MTPEDVIDLLTAVAVVDRRTVGESDIHLWHEILGDIPKDLALQAVIDHRREQPGVWLEPGHIVAGVRAIRRDRAMRQPLELPPRPLEVGEGYVAAMLAVAKIGHHDQPPPASGPRTVLCPHCRAQAGQRCTVPATGNPLRRPPYYHPSRIDAATTTQPPPHDYDAPTDPPCNACGKPLIDPAWAARGTCESCQPHVNGHHAERNGDRQTV
jgi:hypothetical protein